MAKILRGAIKAVPMYDWRKEFEGASGSGRRATEKIERVLRDHRDLHKRLNSLSGLMMDIRQAMRNDASVV